MGRWPGFRKNLSFLPDYNFKKSEGEKAAKPEEWPEIKNPPGNPSPGILGVGMTLLLAGVIGFGLKRYFAPNKGQD